MRAKAWSCVSRPRLREAAVNRTDSLQLEISASDDHGGLSLANVVLTNRHKKSSSRQYNAST